MKGRTGAWGRRGGGGRRGIRNLQYLVPCISGPASFFLGFYTIAFVRLRNIKHRCVIFSHFPPLYNSLLPPIHLPTHVPLQPPYSLRAPTPFSYPTSREKLEVKAPSIETALLVFRNCPCLALV